MRYHTFEIWVKSDVWPPLYVLNGGGKLWPYDAWITSKHFTFWGYRMRVV